MSMLSSLYDRVITWSRHPHANWYLAALSFAESSFFPVPPDVMLMPMCLAQRRRGWVFALIATAFSVLGGVLGYIIGYFAFEMITPYLEAMGYMERFIQVRAWFDEFGFWILFIAGFTPIPYKLFTISAGVVGMSVPLFALASVVGRGARFFLVAGFIAWGGEKMDLMIRRYVDRVGWVVIVVLLLAYLAYKLY